jgi:S-adenosylmethionine/arginine decarboxylase-like enzyme
MRAWGYHLILDASACLPARIRCPRVIGDFSRNLVKRIDMKAYGEPIVVHFGDDDKKGYTLVQLIETSNICAHFCEESNDMYLDVFSCKPFNPLDVEMTVREYFDPGQFCLRTIQRQAPLPLLK